MQYHTKVLAQKKANRASKRTNSLITAYHCKFCSSFHIGHVGRR